MSEIPEDIRKAAEAEIAKGDMAFLTVARAILAERERCAAVCVAYRKYFDFMPSDDAKDGGDGASRIIENGIRSAAAAAVLEVAS